MLISSHPHPADPLEIRLSGGGSNQLVQSSSNQGRVEVLYDNQWGTICDDQWATLEAETVCKLMNLPSDHAAVRGKAFFGQGTGHVWLDDVSCNGTETRLEDCQYLSYGSRSTNCGHDEDVGVSCLGKTQWNIDHTKANNSSSRKPVSKKRKGHENVFLLNDIQSVKTQSTLALVFIYVHIPKPTWHTKTNARHVCTNRVWKYFHNDASVLSQSFGIFKHLVDPFLLMS